MRREFESEYGLTPLADSDKALQEQAFSGDVQTYHTRFLLWATKRLGLEDEAPPDIRRQLAAKG
jgi:hypothetical protein